MILIGDVHGLISQYNQTIQKIPKGDKSIQLGDFGFKKSHDWFLDNIDYNQHKVMFGNHDYYPYIDEPHSLGDFGVYEGIFFIRGAWSIDHYLRILGRDLFHEEELTYTQFVACLELYEQVKPSIVISHDCPREVRKEMFNIYDKSTTSNGLQALFEVHQPDLWVFGHYHKSRKEIINKTEFICLDELETLKF